jgi:hypothetical protein
VTIKEAVEYVILVRRELSRQLGLEHDYQTPHELVLAATLFQTSDWIEKKLEAIYQGLPE